ncbi:MAG TPA: hemerythrin family protein [Polyangiales bacterium]
MGANDEPPGEVLHEAAFAREHRLLEDLLELLDARSSAGAEHAELLRILRELEDRTTDHFRNEEVYMASIDYGGLIAHQRVHRQLLSELARQRAAYARTGGPLPARLRSFLYNWLSAHIEDGQIKQRAFAAMSRLSAGME